MIFACLTAQGLGMLVSSLMFSSYLRRMISYGFPSPSSRPAMMITIGPPSFSALALIGLAEAWPTTPSSASAQYAFFADPTTTKTILRLMATLTAVFIWSLSLFFLGISTVAILAVSKTLTFRLNWWAMVFPNVGFVIAIIDVGKQLQSEPVLWVGSVLSILLVGLYLFVLVSHVRAVVRRQILWRGRDEDVYAEEGKGKDKSAGTGPTGQHGPVQRGMARDAELGVGEKQD